MDPVDIGWPSNEIVLGKLSGRAGLKSRLEQLGYTLSKEELTHVFEAFKELADKKREVTDRDIEALMSEKRRFEAHDGAFKLDHIQVSCGDHEIPTATVQLINPEGKVITDASTGNGPVDAVYKAINRIVGVSNNLIEFSIHSITDTTQAMGDVTIRIERNGKTYTGRGSATDIMVASARAYMNALNRLLSIEEISTTGKPSRKQK